MKDEQSSTLTADLLEWYADHQRDLPWRNTKQPYLVWVAEIMLQQTQVTTVIPFYERFIARFPTVEALAEAPLDNVLKLWEGLGYYGRARHLHSASQKVMSEFDGRIPDRFDDLVSLPGIGQYTAGAILSIAGNQDVPAPDGNARRVLSRVFAIEEDVSRGAGARLLWQVAESLLPPGRAGDFNQALMDLGATVCTPRKPHCRLCPLAQACQAYRTDKVERFPIRRPRRPLPHHDVAAGVVWNGKGQFLIAQRPLEGLLGGLWEFPGGKKEAHETLEECLQRELFEELGIVVNVGSQLTVVQHAYTHFRITLHAYHCKLSGDQPRRLDCADWAWITLDDVNHYAFSAADHKIIAALRASAHP
jgi:A/G-specific adenine glycosylase